MTNKKRVWSVILKMPLVLLVLGSWAASFYAAAVKMQGINWGTPIVFTVIVALYVTGALIRKQK